ncbi:MAG: hypothetical protein ACK4F9_04785 [Brevinematia bacterium]
MNKTKIYIIVLSILLLIQTIAFILFNLYYNDKKFKKFVEKEIFQRFKKADESLVTNKIDILELQSYRIYGNIGNENLSSVKFDNNRFYFLATKVNGNLEDIWLFSTDIDGTITKEILLGKKNLSESGNSFDIHQENIYIAGEITKEKNSELWIIKLSNFIVEWDIILRSKEANTSPIIKKLSNGDIVVAFSTKNINTNALSLATFRITREGDITNITIFTGSNRETPMYILELTNGDYWIVGESKSYGFGETDIFILSFDNNDNVKWFKIIGTKFAESPSYLIQMDDSILISTLARHFSLIKINLEGNIESVKKYINGSISSLFKLGSTIIATGTIFDPYSPNNIFIFEADTNLNMLWEEFFSFNYDETPYNIIGNNNLIYLTGTSYNDKTLRDIWFVKLKKTTNILLTNSISNLIDAKIEMNQTNIGNETIINIPISSTNKVLFEIDSNYGLPKAIKERFKKEIEETKKRKSKSSRTSKKKM